MTIARATELLSAPPGRPRARRRPGVGPADRGQGRPLRPVRRDRPARGLQGQAAHGVAVQGHVGRDGRPSRTRLRLLSLPRVVGLAEDGEAITAQNGRYGPYVTQGTESRSLASEEELFTVDLAGGAGPARPAQGSRARAAAAPPLQDARQRPGLGPADGGQGGPVRRRTSPTARPTRACARTTRSRSSPTSGPPSCWPTAGRAARPRRRRAGRRRRRPRPRRRRPRRALPRRRRPRRLPPRRPDPPLSYAIRAGPCSTCCQLSLLAAKVAGVGSEI